MNLPMPNAPFKLLITANLKLNQYTKYGQWPEGHSIAMQQLGKLLQ